MTSKFEDLSVLAKTLKREIITKIRLAICVTRIISMKIALKKDENRIKSEMNEILRTKLRTMYCQHRAKPIH